MNKYAKILGVAAVVGVVALVGVAAVFAQPPAPTQTPGGFGPGMMGGYGRMGGGSGPGWMGGGFGLMAEYRDLISQRPRGAAHDTLRGHRNTDSPASSVCDAICLITIS